MRCPSKMFKTLLGGGVVLFLGLTALGSAAFGGSIKETIEYVFTFPDPTGRNGAPDPAQWSADGNLTPQPLQGIGLGIADPDNASKLLFAHTPPLVGSDTAALRA